MGHKTVGVGIIGGGYMGKQHAVALHAVGATFDTALRPRLEMICTTTQSGAERLATELDIARATDDYRSLIADPDVDAVIVATPAGMHHEMVMATIAAGKHVFCEKPLGASLQQSLEMAEAAERAGLVNMVGYNYAKTPATQFVRALLQEGEIGEITYLRCEHTEDFDARPDKPWWWRSEGVQNGTLSELASHIINAALALGDPIASLAADVQTVHKQRSSPDGVRTVTNDDHAQYICRFKSGALGHLYASRIATGRKMGYIYEIFGTKGAIRFDQEDQNAVWLYRGSEPERTCGFTKILTGPAHPDYKSFSLGPGHGTGFGDQVTIEARDFLYAIETGLPVWPTFRDGAEVMRVIDAAWRSADARAWVDIP